MQLWTAYIICNQIYVYSTRTVFLWTVTIQVFNPSQSQLKVIQIILAALQAEDLLVVSAQQYWKQVHTNVRINQDKFCYAQWNTLLVSEVTKLLERCTEKLATIKDEVFMYKSYKLVKISDTLKRKSN